MAPLVQINNLSLFIPGTLKRELVLRSINLEIMPGRHLGVTGVNGSGKSTLLRLIHGDLWPAEGEIRWRNGERLEDSPITGRQLCALVSPDLQAQCQAIAWDVSVMDMLVGGLSNAPLAYAAANGANANVINKALEILQKLHAADLASMRLPGLSQGQLRLVLLARAILRKPGLLLLDEWADGLDVAHKEIFVQLLGEMANKTTMVFTSHRSDAMPDWCVEQRVIVNGCLSAPLEPSQKTMPSLAAKPVRKPASNEFRPGKPIFNLKNVNVWVARNLVLKNINWQMRRGENWRITGANGSGKSTFLHLLAGREFPAAGGKIECYNHDGRIIRTRDERSAMIALISDLDQATYGYAVTGLELVCSGYNDSIGIYRQFSKAELDKAQAGINAFFGHKDGSRIARQSIRRLSTGQLRKLFLARAFVRAPELLLLDEAASGLDAESRAAFMDSLDFLAQQGLNGWKPQIILVSHYTEDVPACINMEAHMENGRLLS